VKGEGTYKHRSLRTAVDIETLYYRRGGGGGRGEGEQREHTNIEGFPLMTELSHNK